mgnify:FL=1|jgi:hypothetical protein
MNGMKKRKNTEQGMLMIEALWVLWVTSLLFFFIFCITFIYYQQWTIKVIADETAAKIAQTYKYPDAELDGLVSRNDFIKINPYRYAFHKDDIKNRNKTRAENYIKDSYQKATILKHSDSPDVQLELKHDSIARNHITITLKGSYQVPFQKLFEYAGLGDKITYEVQGNAECIDIIDYMNMIDYVDQVTTLNALNSFVLKALNSVFKLLNHVVTSFGS